MKKIILFLLVTTVAISVNAQIENPIKWTYTAKKVKADVYELHMTAVLEPKWHIYAQVAGEGPEPTAFSFAKNPIIKLEGAVTEIGKLEKQFDKNFNSTLQFYGNKVDFVQKVKLKSPISTIAKGTVTYMVCNDKKCLPPKDVPFSIKIDPKS